MDDHEEGILAVSCDNDHYMCQTCFSGWVELESDIKANPQNILLNGGRITCVCKKSDGRDSLAYANKLIATVVSDEFSEKIYVPGTSLWARKPYLVPWPKLREGT